MGVLLVWGDTAMNDEEILEQTVSWDQYEEERDKMLKALIQMLQKFMAVHGGTPQLRECLADLEEI